MIGISIKPSIGIGDALQYSSLPENYFRHTGKKLVDISKPWFFDHNPYITRENVKTSRIQEMWNFGPTQYQWPNPRTKEMFLLGRNEKVPGVYLSNAEIWASLFEVPIVLNRPRLYHFEDFPFEKRTHILFQTEGKSHGSMPTHIVEHVKRKYKHCELFHIGPGPHHGLHHIETPSLWGLAHLISEAKMLIGMDSGPSWIAACYDVIVKKVRTKPNPPELFKDWVPLEIKNVHSMWDDRCHQIFNITEDDIGFTYSYKRI